MTFQQWALVAALATATASGFLAGLAVAGAPLLGASATILGVTALYHAARLSRTLN